MSFQDVEHGAKPSRLRSSGSAPPPSDPPMIPLIAVQLSLFVNLPDLCLQALHRTRQRLVKETSTKLKALREAHCDTDVNAFLILTLHQLFSSFICLEKLDAVVFQVPRKLADLARLLSGFTSRVRELKMQSTYIPAGLPIGSKHGSGEPAFPNGAEEEVHLLDNEIGFNEARILDREQGIRDIEVQIGEAREIFKDLAVLVHQQGVVVDDISSDIDASSAATTRAEVHLVKGSESVKSRSLWCWWLLAIFVLAILIFLLILIL